MTSGRRLARASAALPVQHHGVARWSSWKRTDSLLCVALRYSRGVGVSIGPDWRAETLVCALADHLAAMGSRAVGLGYPDSVD